MTDPGTSSGWSFAGIPRRPEESTASGGPSSRMPGSFEEEHSNSHDTSKQRTPATDATGSEDINHRKASERNSSSSSTENSGPARTPTPRRSWPPRTCRICLETVQPTFEAQSSVPSFLEPRSHVSYVSEDPSLGRLIRPCKCKGSSRYVHEGCLQQWRHADPSYGSRNFWRCPTCNYSYRLQRVSWGQAINNTTTRIGLTLLVFGVVLFLLGFVADPIIGLYLDPYDTIASGGPSKYRLPSEEFGATVDRTGWMQHFIKGLASLGLLGFVKVFFAMSPWQWWNLRSSGLASSSSRRAGTTGRDRMANISWVVVLIGVVTFLVALWKGVKNWSRHALEKASEVVMDVPLHDDDADFEEGADPSAT